MSKLTTTRLCHVLTPRNLYPQGYSLGPEQSCFEWPTKPNNPRLFTGGGAATGA